jgi:glycosyltransferase involved in cell wall biosynthesis
MRFHVVSLPHTQSTEAFVHCAYTTKVVRFCDMMHDLGHEVFLYSSDQNSARCTEHISVISQEFQSQFFDDRHRKTFFPIEWDSRLPYWQHMNDNAVLEIGKRILDKDIICLIGGVCQKPVADCFSNHFSVEFGVGYEGTFSDFRIFESYAWMHFIYGKQNTDNGRYFDSVIPNYYHSSDFPLVQEKKDYLLYIGRLTQRKGLNVVNELCKKTNKKLVLVGQGGEVVGNKLVADHCELDCDFEYLGVITDRKEKAKVIGEAQAVLVPTQYIGPFEGVHIEAAFCGTPVITTDWGVFTESVIQGVTGFRTRTLGEAVWAVENLHTLNPQTISMYAFANYSTNRVALLYEAYFEQIMTLYESGWYSDWSNGIDKNQRYTRFYPVRSNRSETAQDYSFGY